MGKASKWFRGLFGLKKSSSSSNDTDYAKKRRWSFVKSYREKEQEQEPRHHFQNHRQVNDTPKLVVSDPKPLKNDTEKHAVSVASAAVGNREEWAALKIQSAFRGCLARKALRALKGLVKIQALVRGHIERKRTAEWLHRMQIMMQAQARAIIGRSELAKPINNPFAHHTGPSTPEKVEHVIRSRSRKYEQSSLLRRNSTRSNGRSQSDERFSGYLRSYSAATYATTTTTPTTATKYDDKIVEIDLHRKPNRRTLLFHHQYCPVEEHEARSLSGPPRPECCDDDDIDEATSFCTAENDSPMFHSASSSRGARTRSPFAPSRSDGSVSFLSGLSDGPGYMGCTESSRARARSASAPKQRPKYERSGSAKTRYSSVNGDPAQPRLVNAKAYPGSGRLDKLGMPIAYRY